MRRKLGTGLFSVTVAFIVLFGCFYLHLFHEVFHAADYQADNPSKAINVVFYSGEQRHQQSHAIRELLSPGPRLRPPPPSDSVLLPDWEVLLLLPPHVPPPANGQMSCLFRNNAVSPALPAGTVSSSARAAFRCAVPRRVRRLRPLSSPRLVGPSSSPTGDDHDHPPPEMTRWNRIVYESVSTPADVILFAKGVSSSSRRDLRCAFLVDGAVVATTAVASSAQEVFRCAHPAGLHAARRNATTVTITLHVNGEKQRPIPSLATYRPPRETPADVDKSTVCACTMVYNVAKFLREWVVYHSAIGVERFVLYDNGSEDELESTVSRLSKEGFNVTTRFWPWPKTQEAGFSHCAAVEIGSCTWMLFADVDEFVFSPAWSGSIRPNRSMLASLLPAHQSEIGQVTLSCRDFGPSGQRSHPTSGVTQGYTCRRRAEERHKSLVRLEAVAGGPMVNSVHHFGLGEGWRTRRAAVRTAVVNHYKYQAWEEFKVKFRRRVSAYVADWREAVNRGSRDRTPGLGYEPVEPPGWAGRFCEVNDTQLRDTARLWFGEKFGSAEAYKMAWEE